MNIDWSKAPEWANAVVAASAGTLYFVEAFGVRSKRRAVSNSYDCSRVADMTIKSHLWKLIEERPKKQEAWIKGELPPAGTECEFTHTGHGVYGRWIRCAVIGYPALTDRVVVETDDALWVESSGIACLFNPKGIMWRPIKTAEQLAEEEREDASNKMFQRFGGIGGLTKKQCIWVVSEGYRKQ